MNPAPSIDSYNNYLKNYDNANGNRFSLAGFFMGLSHAALERTLPVSESPKIVVEVGAGTGLHFRHVKPGFEKYYLTDQSPEMLEMAKKSLESVSTRIEFEQQNAAKLTYPDNFCDRLIATHVLEHLHDPVSALAEWDRVVKPGGVISIVLPCDPGLLWRLGRHLGPRRNAVAAGIKYDYLQAVEHVNYITGLVTLIRHHFDDVRELWHPLRIPWSDANLFYICHIHK